MICWFHLYSFYCNPVIFNCCMQRKGHYVNCWLRLMFFWAVVLPACWVDCPGERMKYAFEKVVETRNPWVLYILHCCLEIFLFFLSLPHTSVLFLPLIVIQSHLRVLFLLQIHHVLIISPQTTISIPFWVISISHTLSHSGVRWLAIYSMLQQSLKLFLLFNIPLPTWNAASQYFAHWSSTSPWRGHTSFP